MISTTIKIDISTKGVLKKNFIGSIFRGWLGFVLKCDVNRSCIGCNETSNCPYFMVFKEEHDIKPYSILAFKDKDDIRGFIRLHGERRKFAPKILSDIKNKEQQTNFGGLKYKIGSIEAKNTEIEDVKLGDAIKIVTTSPIHLTRNRKFEVIPSLNTILRSSIRSYNRIAKYYDSGNYPYKANDDAMNFDADVLDFDVRTVEYIHTTMDKKKLKFSGIEGWVKYDTSKMPQEVAKILGMGEALQIGKHTAYGFGGFIAINQEE